MVPAAGLKDREIVEDTPPAGMIVFGQERKSLLEEILRLFQVPGLPRYDSQQVDRLGDSGEVIQLSPREHAAFRLRAGFAELAQVVGQHGLAESHLGAQTWSFARSGLQRLKPAFQ